MSRQLSREEYQQLCEYRITQAEKDFTDPRLHERAALLNLVIQKHDRFCYTITGRADGADRKWRRRVWPGKHKIDSDPRYDNGPPIRMRWGNWSLYGVMDSLEKTARKDMGVFR